MAAEQISAVRDSAQGSDGIEVVKRGPLQTDWSQQYWRMQRSYTRLRGYAEGLTACTDSDEAIDALFHFFQDAYHLKDWIKNFQPEVGGAVERLFDKAVGVEPMSMCADLCNGTKHFTLSRPRSGAIFDSHSIAVRPAPASSGLPPQPALHTWTVQFDGDGAPETVDALTLARDCVAAWDAWLASHDHRL